MKQLLFLLCINSHLPIWAEKIPVENRPNVLFIAIDDLNDWIQPMGGHSQAKTPHIDQFHQKGAVVFQNAVCPSPVCGPSRSALLSGALAHETGAYSNGDNMLDTDYVKEHATLPEYFSKNGYHSLSTGKIFHKHATLTGADWGHWAFDSFRRADGGLTPQKDKFTSQKLGIVQGKKSTGPAPAQSWGALSWGPTVEPLEETLDHLSVSWGAEQLGKEWEKPFFMAIGISRPHLPWIVPQEFFDLYDLETLETPEIREDDLDDTLGANGSSNAKPQNDYLWVKANKLEKEATQAYLASVSYADACLGVLFDALEKSPHYDNTIVIIWGDHGYHLGEKLRYKKNTLWREAVRTPLMIRLPKMDSLHVCERPVSLIDLYPTLIQLCNLPEKKLSGRDISPLLLDSQAAWPHPAITIAPQGTSVLSEDYHYIEYQTGAKEFYDLKQDPMEFTNLISTPKHAKDIAKLAEHVPQERVETVETISGPTKNKSPKTPLDESLKKRRSLSKLK